MNHAYVRAAATALAAISVAGCSLTSSGQDSDRGTEPTGQTADRWHRGARDPRVVRPAQEADPPVRGRERLHPRGARRRRRRDAGHQAQPHRRQPHRRRRLRHRQHLRLAPAGRGRVRRVRADHGPARGVRPGRRCRPARPDRHRERVRQRRLDVVRGRAARPAADAGRPRRPGVRGPLRHPRRLDQQRRDGVLPRDRRGVRRRLAGVLDATCSTTAPRSSTAGRTPTTATSPAAAKAGTRPIVVSYDSSPAFTVSDGRRRPPRCSTPASARWSTPASSRAPTTPPAPRP